MRRSAFHGRGLRASNPLPQLNQQLTTREPDEPRLSCGNAQERSPVGCEKAGAMILVELSDEIRVVLFEHGELSFHT